MKARRTLLGSTDGAPPSFIVPRIAAVAVASLSIMLLAIGARSPYTHANLLPGYDAGYTRTEQIVVGPPETYGGIGAAPGASAADPVTEGARLFVTKGCAACHTLDAGGGPVGPPIVGSPQDTLEKKVRTGPGGMPKFAPDQLTDDELAAIAAYLKSLSTHAAVEK